MSALPEIPARRRWTHPDIWRKFLSTSVNSFGGWQVVSRSTMKPMPNSFEPHNSLLEFYRSQYQKAFVDHREMRGLGAMFKAEQSAGDWSDAPTPELGIGVVTNGVGRYKADAGAGRFEGVVKPFEAILAAPNSGTSIQRDGAHAIVCLVIPYSELLRVAGGDLDLPPDGDFGELHAGPLNDGMIPQLVERLWRLERTVAPESMIFNQSFMLTIASLLVSSRRPKPGMPAVGGLSGWQVRRTIEILRAHTDAKISLEELAREARLSPFHFARAFKQSTGLPPHRYHISLKLDAARRLLRETDLSVAEVAERTGFSNFRALARVFRREIGMTPTQYRRQLH